MELFDRSALEILPLQQRHSKSRLSEISVDFQAPPPEFCGDIDVIIRTAAAIKQARANGRPVIMAYGAHLIKNGLGALVAAMVARGYISHLATNGAGSIHDWEFAFQGATEEDVRNYVRQGQFGLWHETGAYINLAILLGAAAGEGYGKSVARMIHEERLVIPAPEALRQSIISALQNDRQPLTAQLNLYEKITRVGLESGPRQIPHPFKQHSVQNAAFAADIPITIHPGFGYDIIYGNPLSSGAAIGITAEIDFLTFVASVARLEGGVYLSVGSAIMSPMIFEKSLAMARNVAHRHGQRIENFLLIVNDIQQGNWPWDNQSEPPKDSPAYYLRFCKSFARMAAREMHYLCADNRTFLHNLFYYLEKATH